MVLDVKLCNSTHTFQCTSYARGEHSEDYNRMRWSDLTGLEDGQVSSAGEESETEEKTRLQSS